jgi:hypothetical protein
MPPEALSGFVGVTATRFGIPGVPSGCGPTAGRPYACHGVTSVDSPLPVDPGTLFLLGCRPGWG